MLKYVITFVVIVIIHCVPKNVPPFIKRPPFIFGITRSKINGFQ